VGGRPPGCRSRRSPSSARPGPSTASPSTPGLVEQLTGVLDSLRGDLEHAAEQASAATAELGAFLSRELLPLARLKDACGREVYSRVLRYFLGAVVDLEEAYARGWEEIARIRAEQERLASLIRPDATRQEAVAILDSDPARRIEGRQNFRAWLMPGLCRSVVRRAGGNGNAWRGPGGCDSTPMIRDRSWLFLAHSGDHVFMRVAVLVQQAIAGEQSAASVRGRRCAGPAGRIRSARPSTPAPVGWPWHG
jgi:hypothetical protein